MKLNEAVKKAYEKARELNDKNTEAYLGYVAVRCGIYGIYVYANGVVTFDLCGCSADDLIGDYWEVLQ